MTQRLFIPWLFGISLILVAGIYGLSLIPQLSYVMPFGWSAILFFALLNLLVFYLGNQALHSSDRNKFTRLVMILVFVKLVCCLLIIVFYDRFFRPPNNLYIWPFFAIYIIYTVFEVNTLTAINKKVK